LHVCWLKLLFFSLVIYQPRYARLRSPLISHTGQLTGTGGPISIFSAEFMRINSRNTVIWGLNDVLSHSNGIAATEEKK
jgi:hypothetical protein